MRRGSLYIAAAISSAAFFCAGRAFAGFGQPSPWQTGLQHANTPVMDALIGFNDVLLSIMTAIAGLVFVLLVTAMLRFNKHSHPTPSKRTGNWPLEIAWTVVPFCIVAFIIFLSFRLLFFEVDVPRADLTVKATGHQWFWSYSYPDHGNFSFYSEMLDDRSRGPGQPRLLAVNNNLVVPVNKVVRVQAIGGDVIHSFSVPSFGIKIDAIPGRLNETWFQATREGMYYGQCSELCGMNHAFMPIAIQVVSEEEFDAWVEGANKKYAQGALSGRTDTAASQFSGANK